MYSAGKEGIMTTLLVLVSFGGLGGVWGLQECTDSCRLAANGNCEYKAVSGGRRLLWHSFLDHLAEDEMLSEEKWNLGKEATFRTVAERFYTEALMSDPHDAAWLGGGVRAGVNLIVDDEEELPVEGVNILVDDEEGYCAPFSDCTDCGSPEWTDIAEFIEKGGRDDDDDSRGIAVHAVEALMDIIADLVARANKSENANADAELLVASWLIDLAKHHAESEVQGPTKEDDEFAMMADYYRDDDYYYYTDEIDGVLDDDFDIEMEEEEDNDDVLALLTTCTDSCESAQDGICDYGDPKDAFWMSSRAYRFDDNYDIYEDDDNVWDDKTEIRCAYGTDCSDCFFSGWWDDPLAQEFLRDLGFNAPVVGALPPRFDDDDDVWPWSSTIPPLLDDDCTDSCPFANDGVCNYLFDDDGEDLCTFNTDCTDCRQATQLPQPIQNTPLLALA